MLFENILKLNVTCTTTYLPRFQLAADMKLMQFVEVNGKEGLKQIK